MKDSIDWHKQIGKIWAENCFWSTNDVWFNCTYLIIRLIPDFGSIKVYYGFQELEGISSYSHGLKIERDDVISIKGAFKIETEHELINRVDLFGVEYNAIESNQSDKFLNELLITTSAYQLLIKPEGTTGIVKFTFDRNEIENFLASGWNDLLEDKKVELKRIKETLHNTKT